MDRDVLVGMCQKIGARAPLWTQGAGGNISVKFGADENERFLVKATGIRLDQVSERDGLVEIDRLTLRRDLASLELSDDPETHYPQMLQAAVTDKTAGRPSMESGFHAVLSEKWVMHFHALSAILMGHERRLAPARFDAWLDRHWPGSRGFVSFVIPGYGLSHAVKSMSGARLILLENHGLILNSHTPDVLDEWSRCEDLFCREWGYGACVPSGAPRSIKPAPLRIYFPDVAVFLPRLRTLLRRSGTVDGEPTFVLAEGAEQRDPDAAEIWRAVAILYEACPTLSCISEDTASAIANLPVEQFRKAENSH